MLAALRHEITRLFGDCQEVSKERRADQPDLQKRGLRYGTITVERQERDEAGQIVKATKGKPNTKEDDEGVTLRLVVSDTSPIRVLHHVSQLHLLGEFFDEVLIPRQWHENWKPLRASHLFRWRKYQNAASKFLKTLLPSKLWKRNSK